MNIRTAVPFLVVVTVGSLGYLYYLQSSAAKRVELYNEFLESKSSDDGVFLTPEVITLEQSDGEHDSVEVECGRVLILESSSELIEVGCSDDVLLLRLGSLEMRIWPGGSHPFTPEELMTHAEYHATRIPDYEGMRRMGGKEFKEYMVGLLLKSLTYHNAERIVIVNSPEFRAILGFVGEPEYVHGQFMVGGSLFSVFFSNEADDLVQDDVFLMLRSVGF